MKSERLGKLMRVPTGFYPGEYFILSTRKPDRWYKANGEYRPIRAGEYYLSGAVICAYRAPNDLRESYWVAVPVNVKVCPLCAGSGKVCGDV